MVFQPTSPIRAFQRRHAPPSSNPAQGSLFGHSVENDMEAKRQSNVGSMTPTVSSGFSQAETAHEQTADRASSLSSRLSWNGAVTNRLRKTGPAKTRRSGNIEQASEPVNAAVSTVAGTATHTDDRDVRKPGTITVAPRRSSKDTTNSSPVDPAYEPMPRTAVPVADEPRSFLDLDDSSDEERVIGRANSVRVGKPTIVDNSLAYSSFAPRISDAGSATTVDEKSSSNKTGPPMSKIQQMLGYEIKNLYELTPSAESNESQVGLSGPYAALRALNGDTEFVEPEIPAGVGARGPFSPNVLKALKEQNGQSSNAEGLKTFKENTDRGSTTALPPTPTSQHELQSGYVKETVIEMPDTMNRRQALETLPTPLGGFGALRMSRQVAPRGTVQDNVDGLRSNPPTPSSDVDVRRANTAAPPRPRSDSTKKVTIRPSDLIITSPSNSNKFRETVVTTPYPKHMQSFTSSDAHISTAKVATKPSIRLVNWKPRLPELPNTADIETSTPMTDRFPSPKRDEVLFLELSLASHPSATFLAEVTVPAEPSSHPFDDSNLFECIRKAYLHSLLGMKRRIFSPIRVLSHATTTDSSSLFDSHLFILHLRKASIGRKRKTWLMWLRDEQPVQRNSTSTPVNTGVGTDTDRLSKDSYYSPASLPRMSFLKQQRALPPKITLHYEFNVAAILSSIAFVFLLSMLSTVLWVLFGYPGAKAGQFARGIPEEGSGFGFEAGWKGDAEARALTGFVLGLFVLMLGGMMDLAWILAAWILL